MASLTTILDMVKVMSFAVQEGKMAIHCHAGLGRTGTEFQFKSLCIFVKCSFTVFFSSCRCFASLLLGVHIPDER